MESTKEGVVIITGGTGGLGAELADLCLAQNYPVALVARDSKKLAELQVSLRTRHQGKVLVTSHAVDLTQEAPAFATVSEIRKQHGGVRALVNSAGTWLGNKPLLETSSAEIRQGMDLNFYSAFHITQAVLKGLDWSKTKSPSLCILNVGATASLQGYQGVSNFCISKGALRSYSQSLARELGPQGVHVCHLIIDGVLNNERTRSLSPQLGDHQFINQRELSKTMPHLIEQDPSCWTFETEVRPFNESW